MHGRRAAPSAERDAEDEALHAKASTLRPEEDGEQEVPEVRDEQEMQDEQQEPEEPQAPEHPPVDAQALMQA